MYQYKVINEDTTVYGKWNRTKRQERNQKHRAPLSIILLRCGNFLQATSKNWCIFKDSKHNNHHFRSTYLIAMGHLQSGAPVTLVGGGHLTKSKEPCTFEIIKTKLNLIESRRPCPVRNGSYRKGLQPPHRSETDWPREARSVKQEAANRTAPSPSSGGTWWGATMDWHQERKGDLVIHGRVSWFYYDGRSRFWKAR